MRIGMISTHPPIECGIATYCQYLVEALRFHQMEIFVMSPFGAQGERVFPVFPPGSDTFAHTVFKLSTSMTPDIMHIQHEYGLYGEQRGMEIVDLTLRYHLVGIPVVITLHTVYEHLSQEEKIVLHPLVSAASAVIVHEDFQKTSLLKGFPDIPSLESKIAVIEHGIRKVGPVPNAKHILGLEGKKVVLLAGYFRPSKRFELIVDLLPRLVERVEDLVLVVAGKTRNLEYDEYRRQLFEKIHSSPVEDRIVVFRGQFPQYTFDTILSAADVVVLPYEKGAQSGMLAQCFAAHRPVITSGLLAFRKVIERSGGGLIAEHDEDYLELIPRVLNDKALHARLQENIRRYIEKRASWKKVAEAHIEVYRRILGSNLGKARYIYIPEPAQDERVRPLSPRIPTEGGVHGTTS
ncbi:glycosyltransferase [Spirochaeta thermophila]|uniref:Putative glycosyltransferase n=1 Tax=Winmispira thermophila (strain ATCC 49972 / DSM 6192 / RI 19.B1) TaxID=665571 RepID=E0RP08_WINT6|nr:glycosyltransferase [Spirochaeta thermophila]ADN02670.1 putative glycosyltransferase [Spirochaeta thermophila DSM 6192]